MTPGSGAKRRSPGACPVPWAGAGSTPRKRKRGCGGSAAPKGFEDFGGVDFFVEAGLRGDGRQTGRLRRSRPGSRSRARSSRRIPLPSMWTPSPPLPAGPEAVVGTHFFSPAHVMRLLEVVVGDATSPETLATAMCLGVPARQGAGPGRGLRRLRGHRMLYAYRRQADALLLEGRLARADRRGAPGVFGFRMGPFAVADLAGLDIGRAVRQRLAAEATARSEPPHHPTWRTGSANGDASARRRAPGSTGTSPETGRPGPIRRWPRSRRRESAGLGIERREVESRKSSSGVSLRS